MLEAKKSYWFERVFAVYNRNLMKRRFGTFNVSNLSNLNVLKQTNREFPLIIYANHSSWWDGLTAFHISREAQLDSYVMMEEKQLKRLFLFRRLGAFSVDRENSREALKSCVYAAKLLKENPNKTIWIFPQGEILPNDRRPIGFYNGFSKILSKIDGCQVLPIGIRYEFLGEYKPEIFVKIGEPEFIKAAEQFNIKRQTKLFAENLTQVLDDLKSDVLNKNLSGYRNIV